MPARRLEEPPSPDVFISYAHQDQRTADLICGVLERAGLQCWIAPRNGTPGVAYASFLVDAIAAARVVLVVFSRSANRAAGVLNEIELAYNRKRPLLTVRIDGSKPRGSTEFYLLSAHWFDAFRAPETEIATLPDVVRTVLRAAKKRRSTTAREPLEAATATPRGNLPAAAGNLFGREADLTSVVRALGDSRVVTLWGSGGVGKTRLALAAAAHIEAPGGAWFVDLVPARDAASLPTAVATVFGIREEQGRPLIATLADALAPRNALLVLDNCEHVIDACAALVDDLSRAAPQLRFLCTSREPLAIAGETVHRVEPLSLPEGERAAPESPAVQLFLDRATAAGGRVSADVRDLAVIATIVRRLDGIPFAIELAAARARSMPVDQIARALEERSQLLAGGNRTTVARQQTMRATIDWSYELLGPVERVVFRRLAVFVGGWTPEAILAVIRGDELRAGTVAEAARTLTEKSLVALETRGDRYRLLEATREFAGELLQPDERDELERLHAGYYRDLAEQVAQASRASGIEEPFERLRSERGNLRAAIDWALEHDATLAAAICAAAALFWDYDGTPTAGIRLLERAIEAAPNAEPTREIAGAWFGVAFLRSTVSMKERAYDAAVRAAELASAVGDRSIEARSLTLVGHLGADLGETEAARDALERALTIFRELGDLRGVAQGLTSQALIAWRGGDFALGRRLYEECFEIARSLGVARMIVVAGLHRAELEFAAGEIETAVAIGRETVERARDAQNATLLLHALLNLAAYLVDAGALEESLALVREALDECAGEESVFGWKAVQLLGVLAAGGGRQQQARRFLGAVTAGFRTLGYRPSATEQRVHDRLAAAAGDDTALAVPYDEILREAAALARNGFGGRNREDALLPRPEQ